MMVNKAKNKSSTIIGATLGAVLVISIFIAASFVAATVTTQSAYAFQVNTLTRSEPKAPMAASQDGNNVHVVWWTNKSGNWEVMFRASNDGGQTFGDKINLSNSPDTQSRTAEILAVGNNMVFVTWWELNENVHPHTMNQY
jgi:hypothetical protein